MNSQGTAMPINESFQSGQTATAWSSHPSGIGYRRAGTVSGSGSGGGSSTPGNVPMLDSGTANGSDSQELTRVQNYDAGSTENTNVTQAAPTSRRPEDRRRRERGGNESDGRGSASSSSRTTTAAAGSGQGNGDDPAASGGPERDGSDEGEDEEDLEKELRGWGFTDEDLWWLNSFGWTRDDLRSALGELAYNYPYMSKDDVMAAAFESNGVRFARPRPTEPPIRGHLISIQA